MCSTCANGIQRQPVFNHLFRQSTGWGRSAGPPASSGRHERGESAPRAIPAFRLGLFQGQCQNEPSPAGPSLRRPTMTSPERGIYAASSSGTQKRIGSPTPCSYEGNGSPRPRTLRGSAHWGCLPERVADWQPAGRRDAQYRGIDPSGVSWFLCTKPLPQAFSSSRVPGGGSAPPLSGLPMSPG